jgi:hypothetical protein
MKNTNAKGALLGLGLLGAATFVGIAEPATAQSHRVVRQGETVVVRERIIVQRAAGRNNRRNFTNIEGRVISDSPGNFFVLRRDNGTTQQVRVASGEPRRLSRRDRVRVYGFTNQNGVFQAQSVTILRNR